MPRLRVAWADLVEVLHLIRTATELVSNNACVPGVGVLDPCELEIVEIINELGKVVEGFWKRQGILLSQFLQDCAAEPECKACLCLSCKVHPHRENASSISGSSVAHEGMPLCVIPAVEVPCW